MKLPTYHEVTGPDVSRLGEQVGAQRERVRARLSRVARLVAVTSGKGGVGKSWITASIAQALAGQGWAVGVLDADLAGPTAPALLGAKGPLAMGTDGVHPARGAEGILVMSTGFLLDEGAPLRWREPDGERFVWRSVLEANVLREFLADVVWGDLDCLLVDLPPGTARLQDLAELAGPATAVIAVTIPSDESLGAVRRALRAAQEQRLEVLGIVENMRGVLCATCGSSGSLFSGDAGNALAAEFGVPVLARVPLVPGSPPSTTYLAQCTQSILDLGL